MVFRPLVLLSLVGICEAGAHWNLRHTHDASDWVQRERSIGSQRGGKDDAVVGEIHSKSGRAVDDSADRVVGDSFHGGEGKGKAKLETKVGSMVMGMLTGEGGITQSLEAQLGSMVMKLLTGKGASIRHIVQIAHDRMEISDAVRRLEGKLPSEVTSLVRLTDSKAVVTPKATEDSLQKARKILNNMVETSWNDLDMILIECKEFQERNRGTLQQVITDTARLGSRVANLEQKKVGANQGIAQQDRLRKAAEESLEQMTTQYRITRARDTAEMAKRKNDEAVFILLLNLTTCGSRRSKLMQLGNALGINKPLLQICSTEDGPELHFDKPELQARVEQMMTPGARLALRVALGQVLEQDSHEIGLSQIARPKAMLMNNTSARFPSPSVRMAAVHAQAAPIEANWRKCADGQSNCGVLHDSMSLQWAKLRDLVDELQAAMDKNEDEFKREQSNLNEQLTMISNSKTQDMEVLAEVISQTNLDTDERMAKDEEMRGIEAAFKAKMQECRARIEDITFTNICAVKKVRNAILMQSSVSPPDAITDCDVKDWVAAECSMDCDDSCPQPDPSACGGWQALTREVIVIANEFGVRCPVLGKRKKCNQFKCPVNCMMSMWSGWGKCTKECEGGVQGKTRSILTKPRNGGEECDSVQEERNCNTGSCDRDCSLVDWSEWTPCSMGCGGGFIERTRAVSVPIRGQGRCPAKRNPTRYQRRDCNTHSCVGDEVCVAKQDLIILIDASGSMKLTGFEILRDFAANLTSRYEGMYYGKDAMQLGVILYGNGHLLSDGSVVPAINVLGLTSDMSSVRKAIMPLQWQRGFTNLAQALVLADTMLQQGGRSDAQSGLLVFGDGKYAFQYETGEKVRELKDKNVKIFMAPISISSETKEIDKIKEWTSHPWETNFEFIPGIEALKFNQEVLAGKLIAKFCSDSVSPSLTRAKEQDAKYMLVRKGGMPNDNCGPKSKVGKLGSLDDCASAAREQRKTAFSWGRDMEADVCWVGAINVTHDWFFHYLMFRENPPCPEGDWTANPYYDTYAIEPPKDEFATKR